MHPSPIHRIARVMKAAGLPVALFALAALCGCSSGRAKNSAVTGMFVSDSGQLAIGSVKVQSAPGGCDAFVAKYEEDTAWLSPSTKTHALSVLVCGTNATQQASAICAAICNAFATTAVPLAAAEAGNAAPTNAPAAVTFLAPVATNAPLASTGAGLAPSVASATNSAATVQN